MSTEHEAAMEVREAMLRLDQTLSHELQRIREAILELPDAKDIWAGQFFMRLLSVKIAPGQSKTYVSAGVVHAAADEAWSMAEALNHSRWGDWSPRPSPGATKREVPEGGESR